MVAVDEETEAEFDVWEENWPAVEFFCATVATCWRVGPMGGLLGLDYPSVKAAMDLMDITDRKALFEAVQLMERAALPIINKPTKP